MFSDEKVFLAIQQSLAETSQIELLIFYQASSVTCKASILSTAPDHLLVKAEPRRSALLTLDTNLWILCSPPYEYIYAHIDNFDVSTGIARLSRLSPGDSRMWKRTSPRVMPREPVEVVLQNQSAAIIERLADISINGIGVYLTKPVDRTIFGPGEEIFITMRLPVGLVQVRGKIQNFSHTGEFNRLSILFIENTAVVNLIMRYINDRLTEIIQEVENRYDVLIQEKAAETKMIHTCTSTQGEKDA